MNNKLSGELPAFFDELISPPSQTTGKLAPLNRRQFFKLSGLAGGGLALGLSLGGSRAAQAQAAEADVAVLTPYVQIQPNGRINIFSKNPECGQGIKTGLPLIIAEELDASWDDVDVLQADIDQATFGAQFAGGSQSTPQNWMPMRVAGATARAMLLAAAAQQLDVPLAELTTRESRVIHAGSGQEVSYGELAELAATMPVPEAGTLTLKTPADFTVIGKRYSGVDNDAIVRGQPLFGIDQRRPDMVYASYTKSPVIGGTAVSFNEELIRAMDGVIDAFIVEPGGDAMPFNPGSGAFFGGVAIIARSTWAAFKAKQSLEVQWNTLGADTNASWSRSAGSAASMALQEGSVTLRNDGDVDSAMSNAEQVVQAFYEYPYVSHLNLEPQNTTALYENGRLEIWAPSQTPQGGEAGAAATLGLAPENVVLHQTRIGGGFGRRLANDYVFEAAAIARRLEGRPVKLQWTREDDMAYDYYRPGGFHAFRAALDANGRLTAFQDHFITFTGDGENPMSSADMRDNVLPFQVENVKFTQSLEAARIPTGPMRAPGSNAFGFVFQSFLHEVAVAAGRDYQDFLLELLDSPDEESQAEGPAPFSNSRAAAVIRSVAERAGWGKPMPRGRALGLAFYYSHSGYVAQVADVSVDAAKKVTVHKVWAVSDFGLIHNPSSAENQIQGSIMDGLSQLMTAKITFENGAVEQSNLHQYPMLRIGQAPEIDVHFLEPDGVSPTGAGEPGLPPVLPAIANAIYSASGERVRKLPLADLGYSLA